MAPIKSCAALRVLLQSHRSERRRVCAKPTMDLRSVAAVHDVTDNFTKGLRWKHARTGRIESAPASAGQSLSQRSIWP